MADIKSWNKLILIATVRWRNVILLLSWLYSTKSQQKLSNDTFHTEQVRTILFKCPCRMCFFHTFLMFIMFSIKHCESPRFWNEWIDLCFLLFSLLSPTDTSHIQQLKTYQPMFSLYVKKAETVLNGALWINNPEQPPFIQRCVVFRVFYCAQM